MFVVLVDGQIRATMRQLADAVRIATDYKKAYGLASGRVRIVNTRDAGWSNPE